MDGVCIVFKPIGKAKGTLKMLNKDAQEEYGALPAWVPMISQLPLNYYDVNQVSVKNYGQAAAGNRPGSFLFFSN